MEFRILLNDTNVEYKLYSHICYTIEQGDSVDKIC